jgi:hypothetical protein
MEKNKFSKKILIAWIIMLVVSAFPDIILRELFGIKLAWLPLTKLLIIFFIFVISLFYNKLFSLRKYFGILLIVFITRQFIKMVRTTEQWKNWFGGDSPSFIQYMIRLQLLLLVAIIIIFLVLLAIKKKPGSFYFAIGDINAKVKPVKWLGIKEETCWKKFGVEIGIYLTLGILGYFLFNTGVPHISNLISVLKYLPVIFIFASINAFYEELVIRASLLSELEMVIGGKQALYLTSAYFGIGHFYGAPSGIIGVFLASFLGYILGKSMLETRGLFWAFLLHFIMDVCIYVFLYFSFLNRGF